MAMIPAWMLDEIMGFQEFVEDHSVYYIGLQNTIDEGLKHFNKQLKEDGQILISEPQMVDCLNYQYDIVYIILYKSLSKLEYLEYMYEQRVGKNNGSDSL